MEALFLLIHFQVEVCKIKNTYIQMLRLLSDTSWTYIGETCSMALCGNVSYHMYMEL